MSVGHPASKPDLDATLYTIALQMRETFAAVERAQVYLAATPDADLEAMGYTVGETANVKSGMGDFEQLRRLYKGEINLPGAIDHRRFTKFWTSYR